MNLSTRTQTCVLVLSSEPGWHDQRHPMDEREYYIRSVSLTQTDLLANVHVKLYARIQKASQIV